MGVLSRELLHPSRKSRVRLRLYEPETGGFLVTEERLGTTTLISTLGLFDRRDEAEGRLEARAAELKRQRYAPVGD
jgi:hypothetical protein